MWRGTQVTVPIFIESKDLEHVIEPNLTTSGSASQSTFLPKLSVDGMEQVEIVQGIVCDRKIPLNKEVPPRAHVQLAPN